MSDANRPRLPSALSRMGRRDVLRGAVKGGLAALAASNFPIGTGFAADLQVQASHDAHKVALTDAAIADLQKSLRGGVVLPSSPDYEFVRHLWNGAFDRHPGLIARCSSAADVQAAVQFAKSHNLLTAVRCGGHSYSGVSMCDGGLTIDLMPFNGVTVDPAAKIARVSGGAMLGAMDKATMAHNLATTAGVVSHTGIGGLATGGGQGRLQRKFGLTVDNIRGVEVVTADGRLLRANATENPDLYWAVRGGGGNFGIVTQFEMQLHEIDPTMTTFSYTFPLARAKDVMAFFFDFSPTVSDDFGLSCGLRTSDKGETTISISGTYVGQPKGAEAALAPIQKLGTPINARLSGMNYLALQSVADAGFPPGRQYYARMRNFNRVDPKIGEAIIDAVTKVPVRHCSVGLGLQGGAPARVPSDATAYPHRGAMYQMSMSLDWDDPKETPALMASSRKLWSRLMPLTDGGFYINQTIDEGEAEIRKNYGGNYARLVEVKTKYDPTNFFHLNANIRPRPV